jgi:hypothetical protein
MNRGRSFGPYGCLLFLMGLGFLAAGLGSGMVPEALASVVSNSPDSDGSLSALAIWGLFTFGSLGLGSFGIKYYGIRNSTMGFGAILVICGLVGLVVHLNGGGTSNSGNAIWVGMNFVAEITGSLLITSIAAMGIGMLLVLGCLLAGSDSEPSRQPVRQQIPSQDGQYHSNLLPRERRKLVENAVMKIRIGIQFVINVEVTCAVPADNEFESIGFKTDSP